MADREKIITALEMCAKNADCAEKCPYYYPIKRACVEAMCEDVLKLLKEQPEIVRCKDCKWYKEGYDIDGKWFSRCNGSVRTYGHTKPDWFCADGEVEQDDC